MFIKPRKSTTDPRLRSLLQKAVRRGYSKIAELTARKLDDQGDRTWIRSRAVVITFEECWPLAQDLVLTKEPESRVAALTRVCPQSKQKDAAGLGALAHEFHEGDRTMLDLVPEPADVRNVSEALDRPAAFFAWARTMCHTAEASGVVTAAAKYLPAATWAWDKACILAGAYLATKGALPKCDSGPACEAEFPFWVALDKHTPQGKEVLQRLGSELRVSYRQLIWSGFYFESARVNALVQSPWFDAERTWRLRCAGLTNETGAALWGQVRAMLQERLAKEAGSLQQDLASMSEPQGHLF